MRLNPHEERIRKEQYPDCEKSEEREDLIFVYPSQFKEKADIVANKIQRAVEFLKYVCDINPKQEFGSRVIIGFTDQSTHPNWSGIGGNRIHIPWQYLGKKNEPLEACSHELIHPFYNRSKLHESNEEWGDCFCEFLRRPAKNVMGLDGRGWWHQKIRDKRSDTQNWGNVAGQFLLKAKEKYGTASETDDDFVDRFIENWEAIKKFIKLLFETFSELPMCLAFYATTKIKLKLRDI